MVISGGGLVNVGDERRGAAGNVFGDGKGVADAGDVLGIEVSFAVIVVDGLVVGTAVDELDGEPLGGDVELLLEEGEVLGACGLVEEAAEGDFGAGVRVRSVITDVVEFFEAGWGYRIGAGGVNFRAGVCGLTRSEGLFHPKSGRLGRGLAEVSGWCNKVNVFWRHRLGSSTRSFAAW